MIQAKMYFNDGGSGGSQFPAGIHTKVDFTGMFRNQDWWELHFAKDGHTITKYLYQPKGTYPFGDETPEDALRREEDDNIAVVVKMLRLALTDEIASEVAGEGYEDFMKNAAATFAENDTQGYFNIKVILNAKKPEFTEIQRRYASFVEKWVDGKEPKLKFSKRELATLEQNGIEPTIY